ncbi:SOS response-associated peptidase family protein [Rhodanobacter sp. L36]|uniref:SOS response-associated peptidase family protein n=1 Tax=Rhodanobacter sp. L36 TaxID=1747221 RepID=UPI0020B136CE|nr:SOS response-associated peptidase family protein [Rhodanobacter sp. L36]
MACLWTYVEAAGDDPDFYTFATITDDPPLEVVEAGHDRCPVPIHEDDIDAWLDPKPNDLPSLEVPEEVSELPADVAKPQVAEKSCSRELAAWLAGNNTSLAISSYQTERV